MKIKKKKKKSINFDEQSVSLSWNQPSAKNGLLLWLSQSVPLTVTVFLTAFPEASVEVSESKLVFPRLPYVVDSVGQLPLSDLSQLVSPGRRQCAVEGVLGGTLWEGDRKSRFILNVVNAQRGYRISQHSLDGLFLTWTIWFRQFANTGHLVCEAQLQQKAERTHKWHKHSPGTCTGYHIEG